AEDTGWTWQGAVSSQQDHRSDELTVQATGYALATLPRDIQVEAYTAYTTRPETLSFDNLSTQNTLRRDSEWILSARGIWMPTQVVGLDLRWVTVSRRTSGPPEIDVDGTTNRIITRIVLRPGEQIWTSFGTGW